jgi:hypothetical protein
MQNCSGRPTSRVDYAFSEALRQALEDSIEYGECLDEMWFTFMNATRKYQQQLFMESLVAEIKDELREAISAECSAEIREMAHKQLRDELRLELGASIRAEISEQELESIKKDVREKLKLELGPHIRDRYVIELKQELRSEVAHQLKAELLQDAEFVAQAKLELQRKIAGF